MKKIIKGLLIPIIFAILFGFISGRYVYRTYKDNLYNKLSSQKLYLIENGIYDSVDNMRKNNTTNDYIYYKDDNKYKTVIAITNNYDNATKIKKIYDDNLVIEEYYIEKESIDSRQQEYEDTLSKTNDRKEVQEAIDNILNLYKSDNSIKLISVG